jgi:hypothetical protein
VTVVSSSASDTSQSIFVRGYLNGVEVSETVSASGTTPVSTTAQFDRISKIVKSATSIGNITVTSGSVTLAIISPRTLDYNVNILRLFEAPSTAIIVAVPYYTKFIPMSDDNDAPVVECGDYLVARATAKAWKYKRQFNKAQVYDFEAERHWDDFIWQQDNDPNSLHQFKPVAYSRDIF